MSEEKIKVIDKRMFGPDGELREEYRELAGAATGGAEVEEGASPEEARSETPEPAAERPTTPESVPSSRETDPPAHGGDPGSAGGDGATEGPRLEIPSTGAGAKPGFLDLVAAVADPIALYLGDARLPEGQSMENLEAARLYIDLLDVLREKTRGNLDARESALLEDLLYRFRMRYVQKRG